MARRDARRHLNVRLNHFCIDAAKPEQRLAAAIIGFAVADWQKCRQTKDKKQHTELMTFFESDWFGELWDGITSMAPEVLFDVIGIPYYQRR